MIRDRARDEAIAVAKSLSHPEVEARHLLWGLLKALGSDAPGEITVAEVRSLLGPAGSSFATPVVPEASEQILKGVDSTSSAIATARSLAQSLVPAPDTGAPVAHQTADATATGVATADAKPAPTGAGEAPKETTADVMAELDALIGLDQVKTAVRRLIAVQTFNAGRREHGLAEVNASNHLVFTGPPGTGKTTIARLIGRLYGTIGVVSKGHLVEASRADLIAGFVGQTALKVQEVVGRAVGGVLFIDEAYSLASDSAYDFGTEAVAELVKLMEDHRENLAVIVAGYPEEMGTFIASNPGLRSRFNHYIAFPDYAPAELVRIFQALADSHQVQLGPGVVDRLDVLFSGAVDTGNFGNARFARSLFEQSYANMATRALADGQLDRDEMEELSVEDLHLAEHARLDSGPKIGFKPR